MGIFSRPLGLYKPHEHMKLEEALRLTQGSGAEAYTSDKNKGYEGEGRYLVRLYPFSNIREIGPDGATGWAKVDLFRGKAKSLLLHAVGETETLGNQALDILSLEGFQGPLPEASVTGVPPAIGGV